MVTKDSMLKKNTRPVKEKNIYAYKAGYILVVVIAENPDLDCPIYLSGSTFLCFSSPFSLYSSTHLYAQNKFAMFFSTQIFFLSFLCLKKNNEEQKQCHKIFEIHVYRTYCFSMFQDMLTCSALLMGTTEFHFSPRTPYRFPKKQKRFNSFSKMEIKFCFRHLPSTLSNF